MIGILPIQEALRLARAQGLDLVELQPNADPPVCRIMDLGKYLYELKTKAKAIKKKQHTTNVREMRFSMKINENDYQVKLRKIREFLEERNRVRVLLPLRGREVLHKNLAMNVIQRLINDLQDCATTESAPKISGEGRQIIQLMLIPRISPS